jgi:hypothetical protein
MKKKRDPDSIYALPSPIRSRLLCSRTRDLLELTQFARREDVLEVRHLIPDVPYIGPVALARIDEWLGLGNRSPTSRFL